MSVTIAVGACVTSSVAYALGAVLQEPFARYPLRALLASRLWWFAIGLNGLGGLLHVVALRFGPLSLVQPFGVLTLVMAAAMAAAVTRRRPAPAEGRSMLLTVSGLAGILVLTATDTPIITLSTGELVVLLVATTVALVVLIAGNVLVRPSGLWTAAAAGIAFGVCSALTQTITVRAATDGLGSLLHAADITAALAVLVLIPVGLLLTQRSYQDGIGGPLAVSTIVNPITASAIGQVLLDERIAAGSIGIALVLACGACAAFGVNGLTHLRAGAPSRA
ncbi:MAG: hypothetical protein QG622_2267 [Actinomycetota bacterium]|nr:hypothetical protein [Actinomycetota bacterium]